MTIAEYLAGEQLRRREQVDRGLARLRRVLDQDDLLDTVCRTAAACCSFDRVMLSRVDEGEWLPYRGFAGSAETTERTFLEWIGTAPRVRLSRTALENELVRRHEAAVVIDAREDGRVFPPIAEALALTSYVVSPVVVGGRAIGLLHAGSPDAVATDVDRQTLWAFAVGFAEIFERAVLLARLRSQRAEVVKAMEVVESVLDRLASLEVELISSVEAPADVAAPRRAVPSERPAALERVLTAREREVLALMATGATNERIAHRLVIATGTVKSHVKQILRKLRVENRAEAISQYLRHAGPGDVR